MAYAANVTFKHQEKSSRWWALFTFLAVKQIVLIPHLFLLYFLQLASAFCMFVGIFAVIILGRYPRWAENCIVGTARWGFRLGAFYSCMTDKYPPFSMQSMPENPADLTFEHQEKSSRLWAVLTLFSIKAIILLPHLVFLMLVEIAAAVCMFLGVFATIILGRYPVAFENLIIGFFRYAFRVGTYYMCMTDKYPSFSLKA